MTSSSESSPDDTPRPSKFEDFDFFDSDKDVGNEKKVSNTSKWSAKTVNSSERNLHDELHGSGMKNDQVGMGDPHKSHDFSESEHKTSKTYTSSTKVQIKQISQTTTNSKRKPKEQLTVHVPVQASMNRYNSSSSDDDSSGSVTDVSPLPSPDITPRPRTVPHDKESSPNKRNKMKKETKTKFTIKESGVEDGERPHARRANGETLSVEDLFYSSDGTPLSSGERDTQAIRRKRVQRKKRSRYEEIQQRMEASSRHHRRRLLDVAAENSMDLSQLLEVVLEMEQEEKARRMYQSHKASKSVLPPPLKPSHRKNMSFSNQQVRDIDYENQRLLQRLAQLNTRQRPSSASSVRSSASSYRSNASTSRSNRRPATARRPSPAQGPRVYHSATNRIRDQQRIERENLTILKRLQSTKATGILKRENLLRDYERQTGRPVEPGRQRRRPRSGQTRQGDYENGSMQFSQRKAKPVWQDSW
uniref:cilia- and flagella-associated protein 97-like n=1 Tax=Styela clava TaxID=7725 RepID=UPI00193A37C4|nr:cilia- and flagella-associated protein 97-like [Styela clava]